MARWLHMHDLWTVRTADMKLVQKAKDSKSESLLTKVRATTAGIVNGNRRFYRPDRMQDAVHTWTPAKPRSPRPVLIGHKEDGQVLGRVVSAKYVDESYKYKSEHVQIRDSAFYNTDSKKRIDVFKSIDWIVENLVPREDYSGLGYIELGLNITNPDAIQKVQRDEYLTVSVGFRTDAAVCSICHTDWAQDDRCEHEMGEEYDGRTMFLISGNFIYDEVSFVNFPADPFASTISKDKLSDSLGKLFFLGLPMRQQTQLTKSTGLKFTDSLYAADIRVAEETMAENTVDPKIAAELNSVPGQEMTDAEKAAAVAEATGKTEDCGCSDEPITLEQIEEADRAFFADEEALYNQMWDELVAASKDGEIDEFLASADAKLSSAKRKSLKSSTFCGPNRSFPVPDCAHVTAARRLIGRASVSSATKSKILSCVSSKAKSLGCNGKSKDATNAEGVVVTERVKKVIERVMTLEKCKALGDATGSEIAKLITDLDKAYDAFDQDKKYMARMAVSSMMDDWYADSSFEYYQSQLAADKDFTVVKKADLQATQDKLTSVQAESAAKDTELGSLRTQVATVFNNYKKSLAKKIVIFKALSGAKDFQGLDAAALQAKADELAKRHVSSLQDTVSDIMSELKWVEPKTETAAAAPAAAAAEVKDKATDANREDKPAEATTPVNDNKTVADPVPGAASDSETDAQKAQREFDLHMARLRAMSPREQAVYMASLTYEATVSTRQNK